MQVRVPPRSTSAHFSVHPMCGAGGAEISGLDLAQPLHNDVIQALHQTLADYCLLVFRQQTLTPDQQKTFARGFGSLSPTPFIQPLEGLGEASTLACLTRFLCGGGKFPRRDRLTRLGT